MPRVAETTFMVFTPEKIDRQKERRTIDDIVPTACLQLAQTQCMGRAIVAHNVEIRSEAQPRAECTVTAIHSTPDSRGHHWRSQKSQKRHRNGSSGWRSVAALSMTRNLQIILRPPNCRYQNAVIQPLAVGTAVPSPIWEALYEILIRFRRAVSRRYFVNCLAVQHIRHGIVSTHTELITARRLGRSAEGQNGCCAAAGPNDRDVPPPASNRLIDRSRAGIWT